MGVERVLGLVLLGLGLVLAEWRARSPKRLGEGGGGWRGAGVGVGRVCWEGMGVGKGVGVVCGRGEGGRGGGVVFVRRCPFKVCLMGNQQEIRSVFKQISLF